MNSSIFDVIIIGQGLAGSWLALELIKRNSRVLVLDDAQEKTTSKVAAGLYSPITGRRLAKAWRVDEIFNQLEQDYHLIEKITKRKFLYPMPIYRIFNNMTMKNDWSTKEDFHHFVKKDVVSSLGMNHVLDEIGGVIFKQSGYVDVPVFIEGVKQYLVDLSAYQVFKVTHSHIEKKGDVMQVAGWKAKNVVFCTGYQPHDFYWSYLPFVPTRGDLLVATSSLDRQFIFNKGVFAIPTSQATTIIGSTYDRDRLSLETSILDVNQLKSRFEKMYLGEYNVTSTRTGVRPSTKDRRPLIGFHPKNKNLAIFSGFGSKGVSLCPYFSKHFVDVLLRKSVLDTSIDITRHIDEF